MFRVRIELDYPWPARQPEDEEVSFVLSGEYYCMTSGDAFAAVRSLIANGDPGLVLDDEGVAWPFYEETVRAVRICRSTHRVAVASPVMHQT